MTPFYWAITLILAGIGCILFAFYILIGAHYEKYQTIRQDKQPDPETIEDSIAPPHDDPLNLQRAYYFTILYTGLGGMVICYGIDGFIPGFLTIGKIIVMIAFCASLLLGSLQAGKEKGKEERKETL